MMKKDSVRFYVISTYVVFLISIILAGMIMLSTNNPVIAKIAVIPCSWTPTLMLFILFKKLGIGKARKNFIKDLFKEPLNIKLLMSVMVIQVIIFILSLGCTSIEVEVSEFISLSLNSILIGFINSILTGATGEECGWRGYLHPIMTKRYGLIKGSTFLGIIWGFWHAPLWFLTSGYSGVVLIKYIICFLIFIISAAIIIGICYEENRNILIPVGIHFCTNFTLSFYIGDLMQIIRYIALFYFIAMLGFVIWQKNRKFRINTQN